MIGLPHRAVEQTQRKVAAVEQSKGGWVAAFGESGAAGVQTHRPIELRSDVRQVSVSLAEEVEAPLRSALFAIDMAVGEEDAPPFVDDPGVVREDGEVEQHLVDFAVAVAAHTDDAVGQCVEAFGHGTRVETGRQTVARTVVEEVAQQQEHVAAFALKVLEHGVKGIDRAVDVGDDEVFHKAEGWEDK